MALDVRFQPWRKGRMSPCDWPGAGLFGEVDVDYFAGGGGVALGFEVATGKCFDLAVNHDAAAIEMHAVNHPGTRHLRANVWEVDLEREIGRRPIRLFWASPDCRHFSRAKGATPVKKEIRGLAWVVIRVAKRKLPRIIMLENVREFMDWGPLVKVGVGADGKALWRPCPERKGLTFQKFVRGLKRLGYAVEWKVLDAAEYGAPTHRRRLFLIARRDGLPIVWPEVTHGSNRRRDLKGAQKHHGGDGRIASGGDAGRNGPQRRCRRSAACAGQARPDAVGARGVFGDLGGGRRVLGRGEEASGEPFFSGDVQGTEPDRGNGTACSRGSGIDTAALKPFRTAAECIDWSIPCPSIFANGKCVGGVGGRAGQSPPCPVDEPARTTTAKADRAVAAACMVRMNHGQKQWNGVDEPLGTITSQGNKAGLAHRCPIGSTWQGFGRDDLRTFDGMIGVAPELVAYSRPKRVHGQHERGRMKLEMWLAWLSKARRVA